jgi:hypothetical protein
VRKHNLGERMVPVVDKNKVPLMPCSEKRSRKLLEKGEAKAMWKNQVFYIMLLKEPSSREMQDVTVGIDPGSKREGVTVTTDNKVVLNVLLEGKQDVKKKVESRRETRRTRRQRKTPYRKCRYNRKIGGITPSTRARWGNKLRLLRMLSKILPVSVVNVEDIKAKTLKGKAKWNKSFSPLEVGKHWFYQEIRNLGVMLHLTDGYDTCEMRNQRGFNR